MLKFALSGALLLSMSQGWALSLGPIQSPALLGQPLDIKVQAGMASAEAAAGLCLHAEVFYGDVRVPPSAISATIQKVGRDGNSWLRVHSDQPINEPIVTVVLRAGCQTHYTRRYTLLADMTPLPQAKLRTPTLPQIINPAPRLVQAPVRLPAPVPRPAGVLQVPGKFKPTLRAVAQGSSRTEHNVVRPNVPDAPTERPAPPSADGSRLQLEPLTLPSTTPAATSKPASATPGGPSVSDVPTADTAQLQRQLQRLREEQAQLRRTVELVNAQLAQAQNPLGAGSSTWLLYGLSSLVAVLAGALMLIWRRRNTTDSGAPAPWWMPGPKTTPASDNNAHATLATESTPSSDLAAHNLASITANGLEVLENSDDITAAPASPLAAAVPNDPSALLPTAVPPAPQRVAITLEELLHLADKIAFLEGLGQDGDAMDLLAQFIEQHPLASELPYLWWAELAANAQDGMASAQVQDVYLRHYGTVLPAASGRNGAGLEDDTAFMQQLAPLWPSPVALQALSAALFELRTLRVRTLHSLEDALWLCHIHAQLQHSSPSSTLLEAASHAPEAMPALPIIDTEAFAASNITEVALTAPVALAQPEAIQMSDWLSVHEFEITSAPTAAPTQHPTQPPSAELPMLDLDFTPISNTNSASATTPTLSPSAPAKTAPTPQTSATDANLSEEITLDLPPLEFDLGDLGGFKPPQPRQL